MGLLLHGICYDFFFVAGQIYTNRFAGDRFRSSAQGLITLATYGVGILIGSLVSGPIVDSFATAEGHEWRQIWIIPAVIAAVVLVVFLLLFKDRSATPTAYLGLETELTTLEAPGTSLPMPRDRDVDRGHSPAAHDSEGQRRRWSAANETVTSLHRHGRLQESGV